MMSGAALSFVDTTCPSYEVNLAEPTVFQAYRESTESYSASADALNLISNSVTAINYADSGQGTAGVYSFKKKLLPITNKLIAEWQGRVVSIHDDYFVADVNGLFGEGVEGLSEEAIIPRMDVQEHDESQFRVGAFFRLCVNYQTLPNKRKVRTTTVSFRRLPAYSSSDLRAADDRARDIMQRLHVE
jgi:hypothetical protein